MQFSSGMIISITYLRTPAYVYWSIKRKKTISIIIEAGGVWPNYKLITRIKIWERWRKQQETEKGVADLKGSVASQIASAANSYSHLHVV